MKIIREILLLIPGCFNWNERKKIIISCKKIFKRKIIYIFGEKASGKTTLYRFLTGQDKNTKYEPTQETSEKTKILNDQLKKLGFSVTIDTVGEHGKNISDSTKVLKPIAVDNENSLVLLLFKADNFKKSCSDNENKSARDMIDGLNNRMEEKNKKYLCIGTFVDKFEGFTKEWIEEQEIIKNHLNRIFVEKFVDNASLPTKFIFCSFTDENILASVKKIIKELK
ncbi:MAG: GTPase domain-containing protein [Endomicrobiaceae bacterium]